MSVITINNWVQEGKHQTSKEVEANMRQNKARGGGQVVSVLAFYSDDLSSNAADVYIFLD